MSEHALAVASVGGEDANGMASAYQARCLTCGWRGATHDSVANGWARAARKALGDAQDHEES